MPGRELAAYSTDELLYELLRLTRREQWEADPLRFGREVFSQHVSRPSAPMHAAILRAVMGGAMARRGERTPGVGESEPTTRTTLPFSPPVSPSIPQSSASVQDMNSGKS